MARKESKSTPVIISETLYSNDELTGAHVGSETWKTWISRHQTFYFEGITVRAEKRRQGYSWYAFKKLAGKLHKAYVGRDEAITLEALQTATTALLQK